MSYEFEDVNFEIIMHEADFNDFLAELRKQEGVAWLPGELYTSKTGYCELIYENHFDKTEYPDLCYLEIKHRGCFKWKNIQQWLYVFNKYCKGDMYFTGDYGESVTVSFVGKDEYSLSVQEYREIPEDEWNEGFKKHFYKEE